MVASHPFVTCTVLDPQMKRIAAYVHVRALASAAHPQQTTLLKLTLCPLNARQASQLGRPLCSSCSRMQQHHYLSAPVDSTLAANVVQWWGGEKMKGHI